MKVLVACEFSGIVREAFKAKGHDAWSCDLIPCERSNNYHIQDDVLRNLDREWDLMIAHPPCTHLAVSGARWFKNKYQEQKDAIHFFLALWNAPIKRKCLENPVSIMSTILHKPTQIIQPHMFGHMEKKTTCLWLDNLDKLLPTDDVYDEMMKLPKRKRERVHYESPGPDRWKNRSRTYQGLADAMAEQWGCL